MFYLLEALKRRVERGEAIGLEDVGKISYTWGFWKRNGPHCAMRLQSKTGYYTDVQIPIAGTEVVSEHFCG